MTISAARITHCEGLIVDLDKLAEDYISAWNRRDINGLLGLMHAGVAFYDAFWMESCVGRDAAEYLRDRFDEETYWYEKIGDVIVVDTGVAYVYRAYAQSDSTVDGAVFDGVEVFNILDDKIITVSDFYCDMNRTAIQEVAKLTARRHGLPKYVKSGLSAAKLARCRSRLSELMEHDHVYLDPDMTLSQLSDLIGCSVEHLSEVLLTEFGTDFHDFMNQGRVKFARELLSEASDDPNYLSRVADQAGFRSIAYFSDSFRESFGVTPAEFHQQKTKKTDPTHKPAWH